jgi:hypothetical protein
VILEIGVPLEVTRWSTRFNARTLYTLAFKNSKVTLIPKHHALCKTARSQPHASAALSATRTGQESGQIRKLLWNRLRRREPCSCRESNPCRPVQKYFPDWAEQKKSNNITEAGPSVREVQGGARWQPAQTEGSKSCKEHGCLSTFFYYPRIQRSCDNPPRKTGGVLPMFLVRSIKMSKQRAALARDGLKPQKST